MRRHRAARSPRPGVRKRPAAPRRGRRARHGCGSSRSARGTRRAPRRDARRRGATRSVEALRQALVRLVVEALDGPAEHLHPVLAVEARQPREGELAREPRCGGWRLRRPGSRSPRGAGATCAQVLGGVVAALREPGGVLAGVAQVPDPVLGVVVPHVGEQHRRARERLEQLHREGAVHVRLGRADVRLLGAVPVVGVVEEGLRDVHRREVVGELGLGLDAGEVELPLVDQLAHRVVRADLPLQQLRRELLAVVVHAARVLLEPLASGRRPCAAGTASERRTISHWSISSTSTPNWSIHWAPAATAVYMPMERPPMRPKVEPAQRPRGAARRRPRHPSAATTAGSPASPYRRGVAPADLVERARRPRASRPCRGRRGRARRTAAAGWFSSSRAAIIEKCGNAQTL